MTGVTCYSRGATFFKTGCDATQLIRHPTRPHQSAPPPLLHSTPPNTHLIKMAKTATAVLLLSLFVAGALAQGEHTDDGNVTALWGCVVAHDFGTPLPPSMADPSAAAPPHASPHRCLSHQRLQGP